MSNRCFLHKITHRQASSMLTFRRAVIRKVFMGYIQHMIRILRFEEAVYREVITQNKLSLAYTAVNVAVFGLIYGFSAIHFSRYLLEPGAK